LSSDHVTSLLNKTTFDTLIGSIEAKVGSSQNNYGYQEGAANSSYGYVVPQDGKKEPKLMKVTPFLTCLSL
jgi:hypothetical protein